MSGHFHTRNIEAPHAGIEPPSWTITYPAHNHGPNVTVTVPESDVWDKPDPKKLQKKQVERLANAIGGILDAVLFEPD